MKILAVNAGSSSLKFTLFEMPAGLELIGGYFEKIGLDDSFYSIKLHGEKNKYVKKVADHGIAVQILIAELLKNKVINSLDEIDGVGHRVVHGGEKYAQSVVINDDVIKAIEELIPLAPLHNPANLIGIKAFREALPNAVNVGIFDTAFHQTIPKENYLYAIPYSWYEEYGIRKYGFHGTSHRYITQTMQEKLNKKEVNLIICHIGSGGSLCAVKDGLSFDTTMGFTPNAGIMMGTRSGDIDYSLIPYIMDKTNLSLKEVDNILNKKSGLLGISEVYSDHRDIEQGMANGEEKAILANEMYVLRIVNYIAQYYVLLSGKVDALVFTAGLGENAIGFRKEVMEKLAPIGITIDNDSNNNIASYKEKSAGKISAADSKIDVYVMPTNEELMIALDTMNLINK